MSVTYKDIDELTQKSSLTGSEKIPVSDTNYVSPDQIAVRKRVYLEDEEDMPATPDEDTLYMILSGEPVKYEHLADEGEMPVTPDENTLYLIDFDGEVDDEMPVNGFLPNILYNLGTLAGVITFLLDSHVSSNIINHYYWTFDTGNSIPTITWPDGISSWNGGSAPTIVTNKHYEISVLGGVAAFMEV